MHKRSFFAKTGSGQTWEKLNQERCFSCRVLLWQRRPFSLGIFRIMGRAGTTGAARPRYRRNTRSFLQYNPVFKYETQPFAKTGSGQTEYFKSKWMRQARAMMDTSGIAGSLPLTTLALDHALLQWGVFDSALSKIGFYMRTFIYQNGTIDMGTDLTVLMRLLTFCCVFGRERSFNLSRQGSRQM